MRLKELRESKGFKQIQIAEILNISKQRYSNYELEKREPDVEMLKTLSQVYEVPIDYIIGGSVKPTGKPKQRGVKIPVFGTVAAGIPISAIEDIIDYEEISEDMAAGGEYFALQLKGDSMAPRMLSGDVVIVRRQPDIETGDIAIVMVNGNEATCKKIKKTPEGVILISLNTDYEPMVYTNKQIQQLPVSILGKVVELRGKF